LPSATHRVAPERAGQGVFTDRPPYRAQGSAAVCVEEGDLRADAEVTELGIGVEMPPGGVVVPWPPA
jgi:hypothetical protein